MKKSVLKLFIISLMLFFSVSQVFGVSQEIIGALNSGNAQVVFYNILGVSVHEQSLNGQTGSAKVNVSNFATGIYFYTIKVNGKSVETKKLIISR
jgi:hypothetical protein